MIKFAKKTIEDYREGYAALPRPLQSLVARQFALTGAFNGATVVAALLLKDARLLLVSLLSLYFIFAGLSNIKSYQTGAIQALVAVCTAVRSSVLSNISEVIFFSSDETGMEHSHLFKLPRKSSIVKQLYIGKTVILYIKRDPFERLIAVESSATA